MLPCAFHFDAASFLDPTMFGRRESYRSRTPYFGNPQRGMPLFLCQTKPNMLLARWLSKTATPAVVEASVLCDTPTKRMRRKPSRP